MGDGKIVLNGMPTKGFGIDFVKRQEEASDVMFSDVISMGMSAQSEEANITTPEQKKGETVKDSFEKFQYKDKSIEKTDAVLPHDKVEQVKVDVEAFGEKMTQMLKEHLLVSEEDILQAMETLGLQFLDLLDLSNFSNLMVELGCGNDVSELLCNDTFATLFTKVANLGEELVEQLELPLEDIKEVVAFETVLQDSDVTDVPGTEKETTKAKTIEVIDERATVEVEKTEEQLLAKTSANKYHNSDMMNQDDAAEEEMLPNNEEQPVVKEVKTDTPQTVFVENQTAGTIEETFGDITVDSLPSHISVADIMEQFVEHTKVTLSTEITKMEMQLNPEHLGKLYLEVSENQGAVTAKIQAQNVVVKEMLEAQMVDLKQNLNQAGIKVDAIEVTIASHEFERNLEQGEGQNNQQEETKKHARNRSIRLEGFDSDFENMTEEDALIAKIMTEQGNRVDFTA